ncbi:MAG TPA: hypothetical protein VE967_02540 [Gemmatimonadaceae bacterium]|nr:hypothetical protein [Gemmatimonadaceae bacterium]
MTLGSLAPGETVTRGMIETLDVASASCTELVSLFRLLQFADRAQPEACGLSDIVPFAVTLLKHHVDGHDAECVVHAVGEPPAVLVPPAAMTQALVSVLVGALPRPDLSDESNITIELSGDVDSASIALSWTPSTRESSSPDDQYSSLDAVRWLLRDANATVTRKTESGIVRTLITVPSLAAARRLERSKAK